MCQRQLVWISTMAWCLFVPALASEIWADEEIEFRENVEYGTGAGEPLTLHLARPKNIDEPVPGIVFIHGGAWRAGSKDVYKDAIREAAKGGYVAASVGYRFAPKYPFPAQVEDCKCAVRWMRAHADELGVDPERIGALGASAGAHLSMMLGAMDTEDGLEGEGGWSDQPSKVQAVVSYFGPTDLLEEYPAISKPLLAGFIGGAPEEMTNAYRQASPITYVDKRDPPMLLFQGTVDRLVPYQQAFLMATALSEAGVPGRVELLLGADHGWRSPEMDRTVEASFAFFDEHLKSKNDKKE